MVPESEQDNQFCDISPAPDIIDIFNSLASTVDEDNDDSEIPTGSTPSPSYSMSKSSSLMLKLLPPLEEEEGCSYLGVQFPVGYQMEADCGLCTCTADKGLVCEECDGCHYKGSAYRHLDTWWELCNECNCYNATIRCHEKSCPDTCEYYGEIKTVGEEWEVDCNTCTCTSHGVSCTDTVCTCDFEGVTYANNERWEYSAGKWCICISGNVLGQSCFMIALLADSSSESSETFSLLSLIG
eukprot:sb/3469086/